VAAAGAQLPDPGDGRVLAEGEWLRVWCFAIHRPPGRFGVCKRTNCLLALDETTAKTNTTGRLLTPTLTPRESNRTAFECRP
jgi:hypothetical protein